MSYRCKVSSETLFMEQVIRTVEKRVWRRARNLRKNEYLIICPPV